MEWKSFVEREGIGADGLIATIKDLDIHGMSLKKQLVDWVATPRGCLYLWGICGCGKSYIAIALMRYAHSLGRRRWVRWLDGSRITAFGKERGSGWICHTYGECDLLVVDDLGVDRPAEWELRYTYDLFEYRHQRQRKPTIVTANVARPLLVNALGERIVARLGGLEVEIISGDMRALDIGIPL